MNVEKAIKKAWDKVVAQVGPPDDSARRKITELAGGEPVLGDSEYVESFVLAIDNLLQAHNIFKRIEKGGTDKDSTMAGRKTGIKAAQIAAQRFQRRVDIAEFVLFSLYTPSELFIPLANNKPLPPKRIDWKTMLAEWNGIHPLDIMTGPGVFRATYGRILREGKVLQEVLERELAEEKTFQQLVCSAVKAYKNLVAQLPPDYPIPRKARATWGVLQKRAREAANE